MGISMDLLIEAIKEYRREGAELMRSLGEKFGYDISVRKEFEEFISRSNTKVPRKGELSQRVNYAFHGGDCHFHKKKTQQNIEVVLTNPPDFGHLDAWFLKQYLDSTELYKKYSESLDWQDLKPILRDLYQTGKIKEVRGH